MRLLPLALLFMILMLPMSLVKAESDIPEIQVAPEGGDFVLHSKSGEVGSADLRGKVVLLYFGYTKCPDVCPTSLAILTQALNEFSEAELARIQGVFVSLDPARDSYDDLNEYTKYFHHGLIGLTGSEKEVAKVASQFGVKYYQVELEDSAFGYAVNHSSVTYLITPEGQLRFMFPHNTPASVIVAATRHVLTGE